MAVIELLNLIDKFEYEKYIVKNNVFVGGSSFGCVFMLQGA